MHRDEHFFPEPEKFDPTRWTDPDVCKALDKYLFSFGKGSRQCVGMPYVSLFGRHPLLTSYRLAYCELYVTLARVFRAFDDLKTPKKTREELLYDDFFSSYHPEACNKFLFERARH